MALETSTEYKSGFVALAGRPNVGKSTLVNRIMGRELTIVTPKPQTTRNRITAIYSLPNAQMILQDAPGIHEAKTPLNRSLVRTAFQTLEESDIVLFMVDPLEEIHSEDHRIVEVIKKTRLPCVLAINKIDTISQQSLLPIINMWSHVHEFAEIIPISALNGSGVNELTEALLKLLPAGPQLFPEDDISDLPTRFFISEIIREQVIQMTGEEIPYKTAVVVESFKEQDNRVLIRADIHAEKDSQKKILIGKNGKKIKEIGTAARRKIENFLECPVRLELFVKVTPKWTCDAKRLKEFGY